MVPAANETADRPLLGRLGPAGYVFLPGGVVVGPTGVTVVTTIACTERLRVHQGELWHGRFPRRQELARSARRTTEVRDAVAPFDPDLPIRSIGVVVGSPVPDDPYCSLELELCGPAALADWILAAPAVLGCDEVLSLARDLEAATPRRSGWRSSRSRPR